jgi:prepilin-type N-terminal cleavage/methylation domain-containing protein/prepilin-type processing-associated H-X9-DG protein
MTRRAFTLIELMIVAAIVAVAMALLMPFIAQAREDARTAACRNNLKQLGLAMHNYNDVFATLPPGWVAKSGAPGDGPRFGWQVFLLPFVDQAPLYNHMQFQNQLAAADAGEQVPTYDARGRVRGMAKLLQVSVPTYRCPSDATPSTNELRGNYGTSNYTGIYGSDPFPRLMPLGLADFWPGGVEAPMKSNGTFARNSSVRIRDFTDGLSNTFFISEKSSSSGAGIWPGVTDNAHEDDTLTAADHESRPNMGLGSLSSRHNGVFNSCFGDGSVRGMPTTIPSKPNDGTELGLLQRFANRSDGLRVDF